MDETLAKAVVALAIALVSAFAGAHLALRRFRSERWWERKAEAYSDALRALHDVERMYGRIVEVMTTAIDVEDPWMLETREADREARDAAVVVLERGVAVAGLLISNDAGRAISELLRQVRSVEVEGMPDGLPLGSRAPHYQTAALRAIETVKAEARRDLRVG